MCRTCKGTGNLNGIPSEPFSDPRESGGNSPRAVYRFLAIMGTVFALGTHDKGLRIVLLAFPAYCLVRAALHRGDNSN